MDLNKFYASTIDAENNDATGRYWVVWFSKYFHRNGHRAAWTYAPEGDKETRVYTGFNDYDSAADAAKEIADALFSDGEIDEKHDCAYLDAADVWDTENGESVEYYKLNAPWTCAEDLNGLTTED